MKYEKIVFYGDSFTYGQDSGGDDLYDETKTYPTFFGNKVGKQVVNNAYPGYSNLAMYYKMRDYTFYSYYNEDKSLLPKTLNIINMSSSLRGTVTNNNKVESEHYPYSANLSDQMYKEVRFGTFGPSFPKRKETPHLNDSIDIYYQELDMRVCLDQYMIMLAMKDLAERYDMGIVFVDVLFEKHMLEVSNSFTFNHLNVPFVDFQNEMGNTCLISSAPDHLRSSKTRHFYEDGYQWMADTVYNKIESEYPHILLD